MKYLVLYCALVFVSAIFFTYFQASFFQPYAKFDPDYEYRKKTFQNKLLLEIKQEIGAEKAFFKPYEPVPGNWIYISHLQVSAEDVSFVLSFKVKYPTSKVHVPISYQARVYLPSRQHPPEGFLEKPGTWFLIGQILDEHYLGSGNLGPVGAKAKVHQALSIINVESKLVQDFFEVISEGRGFFLNNGFTWKTFFRMLYFSIVTVTTLGYGDIVPVDGLGRFLTSIESFLGVVLLGAFLSSRFSGDKASNGV